MGGRSATPVLLVICYMVGLQVIKTFNKNYTYQPRAVFLMRSTGVETTGAGALDGRGEWKGLGARLTFSTESRESFNGICSIKVYDETHKKTFCSVFVPQDSKYCFRECKKSQFRRFLVDNSPGPPVITNVKNFPTPARTVIILGEPVNLTPKTRNQNRYVWVILNPIGYMVIYSVESVGRVEQ